MASAAAAATATLTELQSQLQVTSQMEALVGAFLADMAEQDASKRTIKMLHSFVTKLPGSSSRTSSNSPASYLALDLGGTNFRVCQFVFSSTSQLEKTADESFKVPEHAKHGTAHELFDFLADCVYRVAEQQPVASPPPPPAESPPRRQRLEEEEEEEEAKEEEEEEEEEEAPSRPPPLRMGFTFSFPTQQLSLGRGELITWTKGWTVSGVEGKEVSQLLLDALGRRRRRRRSEDDEVVCLVNDTVGTLAAGAAIDAQVKIGLILGTGTNAAFVDGGEVVVNTEWGGFSSQLLPHTAADQLVDAQSPHPGQQRFEKLISGFYLGQILKLCVVEMAKWDLSTSDAAAAAAAFEWDSKVLSDVESDTSRDLSRVGDICLAFGKRTHTRKERLWLKAVCEAITERAARLTACAVAALVRRVKKTRNGEHEDGKVKVAVDGSLFEHHVSFRVRLERALKLLGCECELLLAKDGSGLGAALIAAAAAAVTATDSVAG